MPTDYVFTKIDGYRVKLSNLDKLLYPTAGIIKAEVIQYYKDIAPYLLKYIAHRPISLIRFPDGIEGTKFYAKDKPEWAPNWVNSANISDDEKDYIIPDKIADIVWIANIAGLEIHPMQIKAPCYDAPDHFIFDLDPSPGFGFEELKNIAFKLKAFLIDLGYIPFLKTSGSKGLHIYVPISSIYTQEESISSIKKLATVFVQQNHKICTLRIGKEKRVGKVLIDIYRNYKSNSCIAPYSLRARPFAPVSMPIHWDELENIKNAQVIKMGDVQNRLAKFGDPWDRFYESSKPFHDRPSISIISAAKTLDKYAAKRDFSRTEEPTSEVLYGNNDQFVIQLHKASNLHFDLRLEYNGVLLSWAIPKAFPNKKGEKRLAIRTEDHPVKYLNFEGEIPKKEYGGGEMWIFDKGKYTLKKIDENKFHIKLHGAHFKNEYVLFKTKDDQWLISYKGIKEKHTLPNMKPMLADSSANVPIGSKYTYEVKWDGIRALLYYTNDEIKLKSRSGSDITDQFPEFQNVEILDAQEAILDGEIVVLDDKGVSDFPKIISRLHTKGESSILSASRIKKAVFYAFDLLYLDGRKTTSEKFTKRRKWLNVILKKNSSFRISDVFEDGQGLFSAGKNVGLEGIMAKLKEGTYSPGQRVDSWIKVKYRQEINCWIIGYTEGSGDRSPYFGSLHLAIKDEGKWQYIGRVGSGFDGSKLKTLVWEFEKLPKSLKLIDESVEDERNTTWIKPNLECEVQFASWTNNKTLREPVFIKLIT